MSSRKGAFWGFVLAAALAALISTGCEQKPKGSLPVAGGSKVDYSNIAKISITDALSRAQEKYPGKPVEAELDSKDGYLVYKVKIVGVNNQIMEIWVDAGNGSILTTKQEKK